MIEDLPSLFLISRDLEESRRFYTDTLGLKEESAGSGQVCYKVGDLQLIVHAPIPAEEMRAWGLEPVRDPRGAGVVITLRPADVDAAFTEISAKGGDTLFPPRDAPWGVRMFMVRDPSGFLIEISRPF